MEVKPLNLAYVLPRFDPGHGGAEAWLNDLIHDVLECGHRVTIFSTQATGVPMGAEAAITPVRGSRSARIRQFWNALEKVLPASNFDIIHSLDLCPYMNVHNPHGGAEKVWLEQYLKSKRGFEKWWATCQRQLGPRQKIVFELEEKQIRSPQLKKIIAISHFVKDSLRKVYGVSDEKFALVPNGVDVSLFSPVASDELKKSLRHENGLNQDDFILNFVAHNFVLKGLHNVIDVVHEAKKKINKNIKVLVIGRGKRSPFERRIKSLGLGDNFQFIGAVDSMVPWYQLSDVYLAPTWYDACSLSTLEALACGLPVITSQFNGASMYLKEGVTGKVLENLEDSSEGVRALEFFLDLERRARVKNEGPKSLVSHTRQLNTQQILQVYEDVLAE